MFSAVALFWFIQGLGLNSIKSLFLHTCRPDSGESWAFKWNHTGRDFYDNKRPQNVNSKSAVESPLTACWNNKVYFTDAQTWKQMHTHKLWKVPGWAHSTRGELHKNACLHWTKALSFFVPLCTPTHMWVGVCVCVADLNCPSSSGAAQLNKSLTKSKWTPALALPPPHSLLSFSDLPPLAQQYTLLPESQAAVAPNIFNLCNSPSPPLLTLTLPWPHSFWRAEPLGDPHISPKLTGMTWPEVTPSSLL